jgi:hypothetical protein
LTAGNLMVAHSHVDFPSDLATILTAVGAAVVYSDTSGARTTVDIPGFFGTAFGAAPILLYELHVPCAPGNVLARASGVGRRGVRGRTGGGCAVALES